MRRKVVAGNWKMNSTIEETKNYIEKFKSLVINAKTEVVICAPFINLPELIKLTEGTNIKVGAQNMFFEESGAYTGEISGTMLKNIGVEYVIIGHSERRQYFGETDALVNLKAKAAFKCGLKPIVCVGETLEEREAKITDKIITDQTEKALQGLTIDEIKNIIIAYEPIWAIGTGKTASSTDANNSVKVIREKIALNYGNDVANDVIIQYGGSVKSSNARELFEMSDIDGGLVGGASLDPLEFSKIVKY